ncbi:MAG: peptidylprolyl isomerase [Sphingomonas sp.]
MIKTKFNTLILATAQAAAAPATPPSQAATAPALIAAQTPAASANPAQNPVAAPATTPNDIISTAPPADWVAINPANLLVMTLAPGARNKPRRVVIQLISPPFSQGWVGNIRALATAHWWDGTAIVRVQDNYVTQWGDPNGDDKAKAKKLPEGLMAVPQSEYTPVTHVTSKERPSALSEAARSGGAAYQLAHWVPRDGYAPGVKFQNGWPTGHDDTKSWPLHCYGMVGVGRNLSPDTGTGAELYAVIGHAPRHLDRNIALVGRVIEGMENLSSLARGTGPLGFYKTPAERTLILSVRLASELPKALQPRFEYLSTESDSFASYASARANRHDAFFIQPAGGADICNIPVPVRRAK